MTPSVSFARAEPAVFIGLLQALAQAALGVVTVFVVDLSVEQIGAIHGFTAALFAVVGAVWTRGQVTSTASLEALPPPEPPAPAPEPDFPRPSDAERDAIRSAKARKAAKKR